MEGFIKLFIFSKLGLALVDFDFKVISLRLKVLVLTLALLIECLESVVFFHLDVQLVFLVCKSSLRLLERILKSLDLKLLFLLVLLEFLDGSLVGLDSIFKVLSLCFEELGVPFKLDVFFLKLVNCVLFLLSVFLLLHQLTLQFDDSLI